METADEIKQKIESTYRKKVMKLTKEQAITECKELWNAILKSGKTKDEFFYRSKEGEKWINKHYISNCPLCQYTFEVNWRLVMVGCENCPLVIKYRQKCTELDFEPDKKCSSRFSNAIKNL